MARAACSAPRRRPPPARYRYRIDRDLEVPDPASRFQPEDVHGPSQVVDPGAFEWGDGDWRGRPWHEPVLYELHVGFLLRQPGGPQASRAGRAREGPDGLPRRRLQPLRPGRQLPPRLRAGLLYPEARDALGAAINFDDSGSEHVREFFLHNALYWLEEYHVDGLRLDAVHAIKDDSPEHFLVELAERVRSGPGRGRHVHLVLENEANTAAYLRDDAGGGSLYTAQWNDDFHNALHVALTGEESGYYAGYADAPVRRLRRCLAEGFAYQGEAPSGGEGGRGEPSGDLLPVRFVSFLQNHDQVGNRAFGERITELASFEAVRAAAAVCLLSPQVPLLFMGEEWGASAPFPFFCDFEGELAPLVTEGRREEFAKFPEFSDPETRERIPDPVAKETFALAKLDWEEREEEGHARWLGLYRELLALRRERVAPRLKGVPGGEAECRLVGERGLQAAWTMGDGSVLTLLANLGPGPLSGFESPPGVA